MLCRKLWVSNLTSKHWLFCSFLKVWNFCRMSRVFDRLLAKCCRLCAYFSTTFATPYLSWSLTCEILITFLSLSKKKKRAPKLRMLLKVWKFCRKSRGSFESASFSKLPKLRVSQAMRCRLCAYLHSPLLVLISKLTHDSLAKSL